MAKIKEFNEDPEWSDYIMDYEEKILEREQDAREEGKEERFSVWDSQFDYHNTRLR